MPYWAPVIRFSDIFFGGRGFLFHHPWCILDDAVNFAFNNFNMELLVNEFKLKNPPLITIPIGDINIVQSLYTIIRTFFIDKNLRNEFAQEAALLGRLMARRKNSFRKQLLFRPICKLNAALCRLLKLDIERTMENISSILEFGAFEETNKGIPTRDSFVYVLLRLMGVHKLYRRIQYCCLETFDHIVKLLQTNFFLEINLTLLAVTTRIRSLAIILADTSANIYSRLMQYHQHFPRNKDFSILLPKGAHLPESLEVTSYKYPNEQRTKHTALVNKSSTLLSRTPRKKTDTGVEVKRKTSNLMFLAKLDTCEDIQKFINKEHKARKDNRNTCATKSVLDHEWKGVVKIFQKKMAADKNKALSMFQSFLRSKI